MLEKSLNFSFRPKFMFILILNFHLILILILKSLDLLKDLHIKSPTSKVTRLVTNYQ